MGGVGLTGGTVVRQAFTHGNELTCREAVIEIAKILNQCHGQSLYGLLVAHEACCPRLARLPKFNVLLWRDILSVTRR